MISSSLSWMITILFILVALIILIYCRDKIRKD